MLPINSVELLPLFQILHDKGQIVLLRNDQNINESWIITNVAAILKTAVGSIFAPRDFPQHIAAGSTGIVPKSRMSEAFPDLNIDMVIGFLKHFEFCHQVQPDWIKHTEQVNSQEQMTDDIYYLFPALVTLEKPMLESQASSYCCGWLIHSKTKFFTTRFLHILLFRLAFHFALPQDDTPHTASEVETPSLKRSCMVWKNGIAWQDTNGVLTFFEVKNLRTVILIMSSLKGGEIHCVRHRTKLMNSVLKARNEICPHVNFEECIIEVAGSNLDAVVEHPSHSIKYLSSIIADRQPNDNPDLILPQSDKSIGKRISELLYFEPYAILTPVLIMQLFAKENAKKLVSSSFIKEFACRMYLFNDTIEQVLDPDPTVLSCKLKEDYLDTLGEKSRQQLRCKHVLEAWMEQQDSPATYGKLRQVLNKYSIFCGRNPLDLVCTHH